MSKNIAVVIQEDPRHTHRPVEALRIALGLAAGSHKTTVVLLGEAARLLSEETDDIVDVDILEKYLPSLMHLEIPFLLERGSSHPHLRDGFRTGYETDEDIRRFVLSMDSTLVF
jgi:hypothetical protein